MPRKPTESTGATIKTAIGHLSGGEEVALESIAHDMFLTISGVKVARRGRKGTKRGKAWISVKQGWMVLDTNGPFSLEIKRDGNLLGWSPLKDVKPQGS
jgi:hypothetical protein